MSHGVVVHCCFAFAMLSLKRWGRVVSGGGVCCTSPGENRFSAQNGNPQIKGKLPAETFFSDRTDI